MSGTSRTMLALAVATLGASGQDSLLGVIDPAPPLNVFTSIATGEDISGDGVPDVLMGFSALPGLTDYDFVVGYSGADGVPFFQLAGLVPDERFGRSVAYLGDLDADGVAEFAVGAPLSGPTSFGRVTIYSGATRLPLQDLYGSTFGDWFGLSVTGLGDVDLDGVPDLAVGARQDGMGAGSRDGYVRVFSGADFSIIRDHVGTVDSRLGNTLVSTGDLDGDQVDDYAASAPGWSPNFGMVRAWSGATGALLHEFNGPELHLSALTDQLAVHRGADFDGDGLDDLLLSCPGNAAGPDAVWIRSGVTGAVIRAFSGSYPLFGSGVAVLENVDGDGVADLALSTPAVPLAGILAGQRPRVEIFSGANGDRLLEIPPPYPPQTIEPSFGLVLRAMADRTGDGLDELLVDVGNGAVALVFSSWGALPYGEDPGQTIALDWSADLATASGAPAFAGGAVLVGLDAADLDFGGVRVVVDPNPATSLIAPLPFDAAGSASFAVPLRVPALEGETYHLQVFAEIGGVFFSSQGLAFRFCS